MATNNAQETIFGCFWGKPEFARLLKKRLQKIYKNWLVRTTPTLLRPFARHLGSGKLPFFSHLLITIRTAQNKILTLGQV